MPNQSWEDLENFIRKEACISGEKIITPSTTVEKDLGQHGDDADIFMERFFETFAVDRGDYDFHRHFLMEGEGILYHVFMKYVLRRSHSFEREILTVGMLHQAIVEGVWKSSQLSVVA